MVPSRTFAASFLIAVVVVGCSGGPSAQFARNNPSSALTAQAAGAVAQKVVYTGELTVRVTDARTAAAKAGDIARDAGGSVFAQTTDLESERRATLPGS